MGTNRTYRTVHLRALLSSAYSGTPTQIRSETIRRVTPCATAR